LDKRADDEAQLSCSQTEYVKAMAELAEAAAQIAAIRKLRMKQQTRQRGYKQLQPP